MRAMALGLALLGLPAVAAAFPLSHAAYRPQESSSRQKPLERAEVTTTERYLVEDAQRSRHRDDENGAVIREIRVGPQGQARSGVVHCHGHAFPAREGASPKRR